MATVSAKGELHLLVVLSSIVLLGSLLLAGTGSLRGTTVPEKQETVSIAVEHDEPLTLTITANTGEPGGIADLRHDGPATIAVSVPSSWELREVRGAGLDDAPAEGAMMGFSRWHLPPVATASFWTDPIPSLWVHNASSAPLLVIGKRVDMASGLVEERSILVQDAAARLW